VADQPFELLAHLQAIAMQREAAGTEAALEDVARIDAYIEAEDRVRATELLVVLRSDVTRAVKLAALEAAENAKRAEVAHDQRALAEIRQYPREPAGGSAEAARKGWRLMRKVAAFQCSFCGKVRRYALGGRRGEWWTPMCRHDGIHTYTSGGQWDAQPPRGWTFYAMALIGSLALDFACSQADAFRWLETQINAGRQGSQKAT
jgi:hypothetical protein